MLHCPFTKPFGFSVCTMKFSLASECVARANPHLFIWFYELLILRQPWSTKFYNSLLIESLENLHFFVPLQSFPFLNPLVERVGALFKPKLHCSTQIYASFLCTKKIVFVGLYFLGGQKGYLWIFPSMKTANSFVMFSSSSSISSTMESILLQKATEFTKEAEK